MMFWKVGLCVPGKPLTGKPLRMDAV